MVTVVVMVEVVMEWMVLVVEMVEGEGGRLSGCFQHTARCLCSVCKTEVTS
jgi:hypothetical protein